MLFLRAVSNYCLYILPSALVETMTTINDFITRLSLFHYGATTLFHLLSKLSRVWCLYLMFKLLINPLFYELFSPLFFAILLF